MIAGIDPNDTPMATPKPFFQSKIGAIQCLRRHEEVGKWFQKGSFLSTFKVEIVYVEVGRWSNKDQILST